MTKRSDCLHFLKQTCGVAVSNDSIDFDLTAKSMYNLGFSRFCVTILHDNCQANSREKKSLN